MPACPVCRPALPRQKLITVAALLCLTSAVPLPAAAQGTDQPPAHVEVVSGEAMLDRDAERLPADPGMPVITGDRVSTARGRLELLFPDGTAVDLDEFSDIEIASPTLLHLRAGRLHVTIPREPAGAFQVDTPTGAAYLDREGDYRIALMGSSTYGQTEVVVTRGYAELEGDRGSVKLRAGERSVAWPNDVPSRPEPVDSLRVDAFEQWVLAQRDQQPGRSAQYLPPYLRAYGGTLDRNGTWGFEGFYGYVWYPNVAAGWRPYYTGYWSAVGPYGWTWIGAERWAWPTHHYGRWGYVRSRWFWIPERHWAPAWVSWGSAPGYVGWSPLGFDNRPLFDLGASASFGSGWTVLPRDRFGVHGAYANRFAVAPRSLSATQVMMLQSAPPPRPARAAGAAGAARTPGSAARRVEPPGATRGRATPRYRAPDRGVPSARPPVSSGGSVSSPRRDEAAPGSASPRQYPFGDFRGRERAEPPAAGSTPPAADVPVDSARPPRRAPERDTAAPDRPQPPAIYVPPPPSAGGGRSAPRGDSRGGDLVSGGNRGGSVGRSQPAEPATGTRGDRGGARQGQQGSPRQGQQGSQGDGRAHDPGSRRPR